MTKQCYLYWIHDTSCTSLEKSGYVGVTYFPNRRYREHKGSNKVPAESQMTILFEGTREDCFKLEKQHRPRSKIGWNGAPGGVSGFKSQEINKGRIHTAKARKNMSTSHLGLKYGPRSKENRESISRGLKGKTHSEERRAAIKAGLTPEIIEKRNVKLRGKPKSEEHKKNLSLQLKGKPWTEARRNAQMKKVKV